MSEENTPTLNKLIAKATLSEKLLIEAVLIAQRRNSVILDERETIIDWEEARLIHAANWFSTQLIIAVGDHNMGGIGFKHKRDREMEDYKEKNPRP